VSQVIDLTEAQNEAIMLAIKENRHDANQVSGLFNQMPVVKAAVYAGDTGQIPENAKQLLRNARFQQM
jgi:hypothetical protein